MGKIASWLKIPHGEYEYRRGFAAGYQTALAVVGKGDRAGYPLSHVMAAANSHLAALREWRDFAEHAEKPPKAIWTYGPLAVETPSE